MRVFYSMLVGFMVAGCVQPQPPAQPEPHEWMVRCYMLSAVSNTRQCFAGTFGYNMSSDGQPQRGATSAGPFQVYYLNDRGPYLMVGAHNFPGRRPEVRFDDDRNARTVPNDGGVTDPRPAPQIVNRMLTASVARASFSVWPHGTRSMFVYLDGFPEAWAELQRIRRGR